MMDLDEPMEVTLSTEVDTCAKGFTIADGGEEGITVSKVSKEYPHTNIFCMKEGDRILSATIYFDNMTYADAMKILEYSEPYRVQFQLKRKLGKEDKEKMQSLVQIKKDKQTMDEDNTIAASVKMEGDQTVRKREKKKRSKKDRLSWPKFQTLTNTRFLGHRRSRSTSETNEDETDGYSKMTEATFEDEDIFIAQEKKKQYQQEFPNLDIHSRKSILENQITDVSMIKEPHRRSKEKRSLDSSINVRVDHHDIPKPHMKKDISLQSTILASSKETGEIAGKERKGMVPDVEVIIVKGKNLPSPCKVSPAPKRESKTSVQNLATASTTEISTTLLSTKELQMEQFPEKIRQGQSSVSDDTSSPTKEQTPWIKQRKKKIKKTKLENKIPGNITMNTEDSCTRITVGTEQEMYNYITQLRGPALDTGTLVQMTKNESDAHIKQFDRKSPNDFEEVTQDSEIKLQFPIFRGPTFAFTQQEECDSNVIESSIKEKLPDQHSEVAGWKLQMPIIKMPKLPKLHRKSVRLESVDKFNVISDVSKTDVTDSLEECDSPIVTENYFSTGQSTSIKTKKVEIGKSRTEMFAPTVEDKHDVNEETSPISVQIGVDKNHLFTSDVSKTTPLALTKDSYSKVHFLKESLHVTDTDQNVLKTNDDFEQNKTQGETTGEPFKSFDITFKMPNVITTFPRSEIDTSNTEIMSSKQFSKVEDIAKTEGHGKDKSNLPKMPKFKMPSFGTLTKKVESRDSKVGEKENKKCVKVENVEIQNIDSKEIDTVQLDIKDNKKQDDKTKNKLPVVGISIPKFKVHRGHYNVSSSMRYPEDPDFNRNDQKYNELQSGHEFNILDSNQQDALEVLEKASIQEDTNIILFPHFQMPKFGLVKPYDEKEKETEDIAFLETADFVGIEDISATTAVDTLNFKSKGDRDLKSENFHMTSVRIPVMDFSDKKSKDISVTSVQGLETNADADKKLSTTISEHSKEPDGNFQIPTFKLPSFSLTGSKVKTYVESSEQDQQGSILEEGLKYQLEDLSQEKLKLHSEDHSCTEISTSQTKDIVKKDSKGVEIKAELTLQDRDKHGSPYKLPSFKLPTFNVRGRSVRDNTDHEITSTEIQQPDNDDDAAAIIGKKEIIKSKKKKKTKVANVQGEPTEEQPRKSFKLPSVTLPTLDLRVLDSKKINTISKTDENLCKLEDTVAEQKETISSIKERKHSKMKSKKPHKKSKPDTQPKNTEVDMNAKKEDSDSSTLSDEVIVGESLDEGDSTLKTDSKHYERTGNKYFAKIKIPKLEFVGTALKEKEIDTQLFKLAQEEINESTNVEDATMQTDNITDHIQTSTSNGHIQTRTSNVSGIEQSISFPSYQYQYIGIKVPVDTADEDETTSEIHVPEHKEKSMHPEKESSGWGLPTFTLPKISFFGSSKVKTEDAIKGKSQETDSDVESKQFSTQVREIIQEEKDPNWKIQLPSFQVPSKSDQSDYTTSTSISVHEEKVKSDLLADGYSIKSTKDRKSVHAMTEEKITEIAKGIVEKVYTEAEMSLLHHDVGAAEEADIGKELEVEIKEVITEFIDVEKESPTEEDVKIKGKVKNHRKKVTKVEKTITTVTSPGKDIIAPSLEYDLSKAEIKTEIIRDEVEDISPEKEEVIAAKPDASTIDTFIKSDKRRALETSVEEITGVVDGVKTTAVEENKESSGLKFPTFKLPLFSAKDDESESAVHESRDTTSQAEIDLTQHFPAETITSETEIKVHDAAKEVPEDTVDNAKTTAEIPEPKHEDKSVDADKESSGWSLPTFTLPKISFFGTAEDKTKGNMKGKSSETETDAETKQLSTQVLTTEMNVQELTGSIKKAVETLETAQTIVERRVIKDEEETMDKEKDSGWKIQLTSFQVPTLSKSETSDKAISQYISLHEDMVKCDLKTDATSLELTECTDEKLLPTETIQSLSEVPVDEIASGIVEKVYSKAEKSVTKDERGAAEDADTGKKIVDGMITIDMDKETSGWKLATFNIPLLTTKEDESVSAVHESSDSMQKADIDPTPQLQTEIATTDKAETTADISVHEHEEKSLDHSKTKESVEFTTTSNLKVGITVIGESIHMSPEDVNVKRSFETSVEAHEDSKWKNIEEESQGWLKEMEKGAYSEEEFQSEREFSQLVHSKLQQHEGSVTDRRPRVLSSQHSFPRFGITVLQESISISEDDPPTLQMDFTDNIFEKSGESNILEISPQKIETEDLVRIQASDSFNQNENISLVMKGETQGISSFIKIKDETIKTIDAKVQQLILEDETESSDKKDIPSFKISKTDFIKYAPKTKLGEDGAETDVMHEMMAERYVNVSYRDKSNVKSLEKSEAKILESEENDSLINAFSITLKNIESKEDSNILYQTPFQETSEIALPRFSTPKLGVAVIEESIFIGDEETTRSILDHSTGEESIANILREEDVAETTEEHSEPTGWKFQMPTLKMNIFSKKDDIATSSKDFPPTKEFSVHKEVKSMEIDNEAQLSTEEKPRSPFKLPSFKLPSLTLRGKKEKSTENIVSESSFTHKVLETDKSSFEQDPSTEIQQNTDVVNIEKGNESEPSFDDKIKIKGEFNELESSKHSVNTSTDNVDIKAEPYHDQKKPGEYDVQTDVHMQVTDVIGNVKMDILESVPAEEIKIEFPFFKSPLIVPQEIASDSHTEGDYLHKEEQPKENTDEQVVFKSYKTALHKTKAVHLSDDLPDTGDDSVVLDVEKVLSVPSEKKSRESKAKPTKKPFKLSFPKVKLPVLAFSDPQDGKESFNIIASHDESGIVLPEYDLDSEEECQTVDIRCVANQSVLDITEAILPSSLANTEVVESVKLQQDSPLTSSSVNMESEMPPIDSKGPEKENVDDVQTVRISQISYISCSFPSTEQIMETSIMGDNSDSSSPEIQSEYENVSPDAYRSNVEKKKLSSGIVKEYEISSSELQIPTYGFSLLKVKLPEMSTAMNAQDIGTQVSDTHETSHDLPVIQDKTSAEASEIRVDRSMDELNKSEQTVSSKVHVPKMRTYTFEVKSSSQTSVSSFPLHTTEEVATTEEPLPKQENVKDKEEEQKLPSKFRFWLPNIGFSSSVDETETRKGDMEEQKQIELKSDKASSTPKEKVPWYKFPKLGFSSVENKKSVDQAKVEKPEEAIDIDKPERKENTSLVKGAGVALAEPEIFTLDVKDLEENSSKSS